MKAYVITGGAGFIGSSLARRLLADGNEVYVIDDLSTGYEENVPQGAFLQRADISNTVQMNALSLPDKINAVFHIAGQPSGEASFGDPLRDADVNYKGTYNALSLAESKKATRFIYTSSMSVYGEVDPPDKLVREDDPCNPYSYYGCNKLASEKMISIFCREKDIEPTSLRLFNVYGPGQNMLNMMQGMVSIYMSFLMKNEPVFVKGSLDRFRDLVYIDDVVEAMVRVEQNPAGFGQIYNVGTGVKTTVRELLQQMLAVYEKNALEDFDQWVTVGEGTPGDTFGCVGDIAKVKKELLWEPRFDIQRGLAQMKQWADETALRWEEKHGEYANK